MYFESWYAIADDKYVFQQKMYFDKCIANHCMQLRTTNLYFNVTIFSKKKKNTNTKKNAIAHDKFEFQHVDAPSSLQKRSQHGQSQVLHHLSSQLEINCALVREDKSYIPVNICVVGLLYVGIFLDSYFLLIFSQGESK